MNNEELKKKIVEVLKQFIANHSKSYSKATISARRVCEK